MPTLPAAGNSIEPKGILPSPHLPSGPTRVLPCNRVARPVRISPNPGDNVVDQQDTHDTVLTPCMNPPFPLPFPFNTLSTDCQSRRVGGTL